MDEALNRALPPPPESGDGQPYYIPPPLPRRDKLTRHVVLFLATLVSTSAVGGCHYLGFATGFKPQPPIPADQLTSYLTTLFTDPTFYLNGLWYSLAVLTILGCHEMGHYLACRYYHVDASLPYFLPAPLPLTGTLGAVIRIRQRIPSKVALFDIGIAGPIAGFVVTLPILYVGLMMSTVEPLPAELPDTTVWLGEPLLFRAAAWMVFGDRPPGTDINLHPMAFASWFGLLATALNLFPIGQLDGGHVAYAVFGRRSAILTVVMVTAAVALTWYSTSWLVWTILMLVMLLAMGPHHPPTLDDDARLDDTRLALAFFALVMLIVCFTPAPIETFVTGQQ